MAIVHRGRLVFEHYANGMTARDAAHPDVGVEVDAGLAGATSWGSIPSARSTDIVPELADTAYRGATMRHLLDMRAGIAWDENYLATSGPIVEYRKSTGWNPLGPGEPPSDLHSFYAS